eukprot:1120680-Amphidinium_carterae.1
MVFPEAPFHTGPHHGTCGPPCKLQCFECGRQTGKVKGEYNFSYLKRQKGRRLKKKKVKVRPAGILAPKVRSTDPSGAGWSTADGFFGCV